MEHFCFKTQRTKVGVATRQFFRQNQEKNINIFTWKSLLLLEYNAVTKLYQLVARNKN